MTLHCLIVDDEPPARKVISHFIDKTPFLELTASCADALKALQVLEEKKIDVIFLDVRMPEILGTTFLKSLRNPPLVIFTTAYPEYAVECFELEAVDYLLKPFSFERFLKASQKAHYLLETESKMRAISESECPPLWVKSDKRLFKVLLEEILYLQAYGDYIKIFRTRYKPLVTKARLTTYETQLPPSRFYRIHRSYIISLDAVQFIEGNQVCINDTKLPVSSACKNELLNRLTDRS
jgi:DNA-binding LytR/AlgR family response regulator